MSDQTGLRISETLAPLPLDAVTSTFAILAVRGAGKSYTGSVSAEEMIGARQRVCIIDPTDVWWGLRASSDGQPNGLPVVVFGGKHADVDLSEEDGSTVADLIVDGDFSCILSTKHFETDASRVRFLLAFARRLYFRNVEPLHLFLDEADDYIPQVVTGDVAKLVGAWTKIVRHGRAQGIGITLITQRAASLNKNVLSQIETLIALRTTSPHDIDAIKDWMRAAGKNEHGVIATLPALKTGEAWIWSPSFLGIDPPVRAQIRARHTFNSSATPKVGERRVEPKALAPVDIDAIRKALAPKVEAKKTAKVGADLGEVFNLTARVAELEEQLANVQPERVEVPVMDEKTQAQLQLLIGLLVDVERHVGPMREAVERITQAPVSFEAPPCEHFSGPLSDETLAKVQGFTRKSADFDPFAVPAVYGPGRFDEPHTPAGRPPAPPPPPRAASGGPKLDAGARRILGALASFHPRPLTRAQAAALAGLGAKGTTFRTYLSQLSTNALVTRSGDEIALTAAGVKAAGPTQKPTTTVELVRTWGASLDAGARKILDCLVAVHPRALSREDVARRVAIDAGGTTFRTYLSQLSTRGLVDRQGNSLRASESLFLGARS